MNERLAVTIMVSVCAAALVAILRASQDHSRRVENMRAQVEMFNKLIDKIGSGTDVSAFLQQGGGLNLLKPLAEPAVEPRAPHGRILTSIQIGIVVAALGLGALSLQDHFVTWNDRLPAAVLGTLLLSGGIGFLVAGAASWFLSHRLGLLNGRAGKAE